jgi:hypothetical protein
MIRLLSIFDRYYRFEVLGLKCDESSSRVITSLSRDEKRRDPHGWQVERKGAGRNAPWQENDLD